MIFSMFVTALAVLLFFLIKNKYLTRTNQNKRNKRNTIKNKHILIKKS